MSTPWTPQPDEDDVAVHDDGAPEVPEDDQDPEVPEPPVTGDPAVDSATASVAAAAAAPLEEQVQAFEVAHRALQDRLADVDG